MSDRKPSPSEVRHHYARVHNLHEKLQQALNDAHNANVIVYEGEFRDVAPCHSHWKTLERFETTTQKQLAAAMRTEILRGKK